MTHPITMRIVSGVQPSGFIHIGNYLGAFNRWVKLQEDTNNDCFFFLADLHSLTLPQDPKQLSQQIFDTMRSFLAVGLDPAKCTMYVQSEIPHHTELNWIFNTLTPLSELKDMHQFKEKSVKHKNDINAGLFTYPVLQSADVLLYDGEMVPVGEDQRQHIELMRDIARKFNKRFGQTFPEPKFYEGEKPLKIMGLQHPEDKMSKSDDNANNAVGIFDEPDVIRKKISKAVTDSENEIKFDEDAKPGLSNLLTIHALISDRSVNDSLKAFEGKSYGEFKNDLVEMLIEHFSPMRERFEQLASDEAFVRNTFADGTKKATALAAAKAKTVKEKVGL